MCLNYPLCLIISLADPTSQQNAFQAWLGGLKSSNQHPYVDSQKASFAPLTREWFTSVLLTSIEKELQVIYSLVMISKRL